MMTVNEQAAEARKVRRVAERISYLAKHIETDYATNEQRHAWWSEIRADAFVLRQWSEHARDDD